MERADNISSAYLCSYASGSIDAAQAALRLTIDFLEDAEDI